MAGKKAGVERKMFAEISKIKQEVKNQINSMIVKEFTDTNKRGNHLLLDSVTFGSSKTYRKHGVPSVNIHIPQIEVDEFIKMVEVRQPVKIFRCSANNLLSHFLKRGEPFQSIYLDYCCTANGNKQVTPITDLKLAIQLLNDDGILAWTFSTRSSKKQIRKFQAIDKVRRDLDEYAKTIGVTLRHLFSFPFKSTSNKKRGRPKKNKKGNFKGQSMYITAVRVEKILRI